MDKIDQSKLRERIVDCFKRSHVQTEGDTELFDTEITIDNIMALFSEALKEADVSGRIAELKKLPLKADSVFGIQLHQEERLKILRKRQAAALQPKTGEEKDE